MHVLLTEAKFGDCDALSGPLRDNGCRVSRCHSREGICLALGPGTSCPLDDRADPPVLAVDVRGSGDEITAREYGVVCALRALVPVALVPPEPGLPVTVPAGLEDRVTVTDAASLLATCRAASLAPAGAGR
ncbi:MULTISPECIES: hypothetical protein [Amycolatopsis]|uniref:Uncharacterized protein n=1 Tax=Amycolatopsis dendrobii TaxID=2760662 RepID=A0A7W3W615_9PSEU|nr:MULTISPECIES: hypothetical protein [Amycolatopsis]MBB1159511.1 hypothetical protein [Amycolatopsis dendrobii]UKD57405.1 hypothetical protein L3Q65_11980 [Amycolatopsis sp. FU40]